MTKILEDVDVGVIEALKPVTSRKDVVALTNVSDLVTLTTCNTAPVAALMLSTPVAPVIVVVITYPFGLAALTAVRSACRSVNVPPPSSKA